MRTRAQSRVLVRTLGLGRNYGGLLQAYALQRVIEGLGHEVHTDAYEPPVASRLVRSYLAFKPVFLKRPLVMSEVVDLVDGELLQFCRRRIRTVNTRSLTGRTKRNLVRRYSAFVVGSDQVWRARYSDVPSRLFDYVPENFAGRRLSYSASFGLDNTSEYSAELIAATAPLARRLDGVSVREDSGVRLVLELWGRDDAEHHVDPTLLLRPEDYDTLIDSAASLEGAAEPEGVLSYILDGTHEKSSIGEAIASGRGGDIHSLLRPFPSSLDSFLSAPDSFRKISVEAWLKSIRDAQFVVTDSFHGCVFSILFHTPFLVLPNVERGKARFDSLLSMFELHDRAITVDGSDAAVAQALEVAASPIEWSAVSERIEGERMKALEYLRRYL